MRYTAWISILCMAGASCVMVACGDNESSTSGSGGSGTGGSASSSSASGSGSSSASGSSSSSSGGGSSIINGCDTTMLEDHTGQTDVAIQFGGLTLGTKYAPPCISVSPGTKVTFVGNFVAHPLRAGVVSGGVATEDPTSPITATSMGMSATFTLDKAGNYPYYCLYHFSDIFKMYGLIVVK